MNTYRIDGMPISQSQFMLEINTGRIGGAFGVMRAITKIFAWELYLQINSIKMPTLIETLELDVLTVLSSFDMEKQKNL